MFGLLRRWRDQTARTVPSPSFDAVLDLDPGSLPTGLAAEAAMTAVHERLARGPGARRVVVRVRAAPAPIVLRLFAPGGTVEPDGAAWVAVRARVLAGAADALLEAPRREVPSPVAYAVPGFAEAPSMLHADGLAALAALARSMATSVAPPPKALHSPDVTTSAAAEPGTSDVDRLTRLLGFILPSEDRATATRALRQFGSFGAVLAAPASELEQVQGLGPHCVAAIRLVHEAAVRLRRAGIASQPVLSDRRRLEDYLATALARERIEQFRVLFLDRRGMLLADEVQARGTVNHTPVYPREVVRRALELGATALILVHNHPSGDPTPSPEDIAMTRQVSLAAAALQLDLRDHLVVGNGRISSLRDAGFLYSDQ